MFRYTTFLFALLAVLGLVSAIPAQDVDQGQGAPGKSFLGATLGSETKEGHHGLVVQRVMPSSPAEKAGLKVGDIITRVNDKQIESLSDLTGMMRQFHTGDQVRLEVLRDAQEKA